MNRTPAVICALVVALAVTLERRVVNGACNASLNGSFVNTCVCADGEDQNSSPLDSTDCHPERSSLIADTVFVGVCPCAVRVRATWACNGVKTELYFNPDGIAPQCTASDGLAAICWGTCWPFFDPTVPEHGCDGDNWSANGILQADEDDPCPGPTDMRISIVLNAQLSPCGAGSTCSGCVELRTLWIRCREPSGDPCP